jgi:hypothetical protein
MKQTASRPILCALLSALSSSAFCGSTLDSRPLDREIQIDGLADDWHDSLTFIKKAGFAVGAFNDRRDLYLCVNSWNEDVNLQIEGMGWVLWFSPDRSHPRSIGVEFPLPHEKRAEADDASDVRPDAADRLAIRGPRPEEREVLAVSNAAGVIVRSSTINGAFTYELKIPLGRDSASPYGIGAEPGQTIEVLFETNGVGMLHDRTGSGEAPPSGASGGGVGGRGGGGGRRMGGGGRGRRGGGGRGPSSGDEAPSLKVPKPLSLVLRLRLAAETPEGPPR